MVGDAGFETTSSALGKKKFGKKQKNEGKRHPSQGLTQPTVEEARQRMIDIFPFLLTSKRTDCSGLINAGLV